MMKTLQQFISQHSVAPGQTQPGAISIDEVWEHPFSGPDSEHHSDAAIAEPITLDVRNSRDFIQMHHDELKKHYKIPVKSREPIHQYVSHSVTTNQKLLGTFDDRADPVVSAFAPKDHQAHVNALQSLLTKQTTPHDMHVYSGINFKPDTYAEPNDKGPIKVRMPAFTSTSLNHKIAVDFGGYGGPTTERNPARHIIKIHVPEGSHGAYIGHISSQSAEREFILPHGSKLHVHPEPTQTTDRFNRNLTIWHAKLVHDGIKPTRHANEDA